MGQANQNELVLVCRVWVGDLSDMSPPNFPAVITHPHPSGCVCVCVCVCMCVCLCLCLCLCARSPLYILGTVLLLLLLFFNGLPDMIIASTLTPQGLIKLNPSVTESCCSHRVV